MAKLVVITRGIPALPHELGANWTTIGREQDNAFQIVESSVSGRHCEVRLKGDELIVRDLLSTNGTLVGGEKITEAVLKANETVRVGEVGLRFDNSVAAPGNSFVSQKLGSKTAARIPPKPAPAAVEKNLPIQSETGDEPAKKHHVLFVDDSMAFLETFGELCSALSNQTWEIHSATTADSALAVLQEKSVDLVVLDMG